MIKIYFNLHKDTFSIQEKTDKGWRVTRYADSIFLKNVKFNVSESGRQRVLKEKRKNVHAFVVGEEFDKKNKKVRSEEIKYNPYEFPYFHNSRGDKILDAEYVELAVDNKRGRVYILQDI